MGKTNSADVIIRELLNTLDYIARLAVKNDEYATAYIKGAAEFAIETTKAKMVYNGDGYLVVKR